jgi:hypothetical protein
MQRPVNNNYDSASSMLLVPFAMWSDHRLYNKDQLDSSDSCSHESKAELVTCGTVASW